MNQQTNLKELKEEFFFEQEALRTSGLGCWA